MKKYTIIIITILFLAFSILGLHFTLKALLNKDITDIPAIARQNTFFEFDGSCSDKRKVAGLENSENPYLTKLYSYQEGCNSFVTNSWMIFIDMPKDQVGADRKASELAINLNEFNKYGITPIVIVEPVTDWGLIDFVEYNEGLYDPWIEMFFKELKNDIPEGQMNAIWVPFPEPNLPYWNRATATSAQVGENISKYLSILKKHYPEAHGSLLLNSKSYAEDDFNWVNGEFSSLLPYLEKIDKNLIDSAGLQGLPWLPPATSTEAKPETDPDIYLNSKLLLEMAYFLDTKEVWFNTGTFGTKYSQDSENIVFVNASQRKTMLEGVFREADEIKRKGYNVSVNLFSEDKTNTQEQTDWSYWSDPSITTNEKTIFIEFVRKLHDNDIGLSIYDK